MKRKDKVFLFFGENKYRYLWRVKKGLDIFCGLGFPKYPSIITCGRAHGHAIRWLYLRDQDRIILEGQEGDTLVSTVDDKMWALYP